jgi:hypothetical protein
MNRVCSLFSAAWMVALPLMLGPNSSLAGELPSKSQYRVLPPISHGELTIFPVTASVSHDSSNFITLDEGLRSGQVVVTEAGRVVPLMRRRPYPVPPQWSSDAAQVNRLVLVNNANRPLILLAGEIVTGGKQDRVVGKDRIVPANSDPIDLGVFCVEPGRWIQASDRFAPMSEAMAQPSVRRHAMADRDQQKVWSAVRESAEAAAGLASPPTASRIRETTSYAKVMQNDEIKKQVDEVAAPVGRSFENVIRHLRSRNAVGVVVAVRGQILWADLFAGTELLEKYWPKLARSYAAEAITGRGSSGQVDSAAAQAFLQSFDGTRQIVESEPGVYRHTEISGAGFKAFELTSLLPRTGFDLHISKMAE